MCGRGSEGWRKAKPSVYIYGKGGYYNPTQQDVAFLSLAVGPVYPTQKNKGREKKLLAISVAFY